MAFADWVLAAAVAGRGGGRGWAAWPAGPSRLEEGGGGGAGSWSASTLGNVNN